MWDDPYLNAIIILKVMILNPLLKVLDDVLQLRLNVLLALGLFHLCFLLCRWVKVAVLFWNDSDHGGPPNCIYCRTGAFAPNCIYRQTGFFALGLIHPFHW